jgi:hypothetical protein
VDRTGSGVRGGLPIAGLVASGPRSLCPNLSEATHSKQEDGRLLHVLAAQAPAETRSGESDRSFPQAAARPQEAAKRR